MFPGLMLQVQTEYVSVTYYNMLIPLEFNVFDTIGRSLPSIIKFPNWTVLPLVVSRIIFFPLIIFCVNPLLFSNAELCIYGINVIFAISNGFLATLCMVYAPMKVKNEEQETTGFLMAFFINIGLLAGTNFAILLNWLVETW